MSAGRMALHGSSWKDGFRHNKHHTVFLSKGEKEGRKKEGGGRRKEDGAEDRCGRTYRL